MTEKTSENNKKEASLFHGQDELVYQIIENLHAFFYVKDIKTNSYLFMSPKLKEIFGRDICNTNDGPLIISKEYVHPDDRERYLNAITIQDREGIYFNEEYRMRFPDGSYHWIWTRSYPVKSENDKVERIVGIAEDITERKLNQEALRESQDRIKMALEGTDEGIWDWDMVNGDITFDENWPKVLGYDNGERDFNFDWWKKSIHPDSQPVFEKALADYLEGREKYLELDYQILSKSGEWRWIWGRGKCMSYDNDGNPLQMIGTHRDITDKKRFEELILENKSLILADQKKTEFLLNMNHEIRTPLNASIGFSELMKSGVGGELTRTQNEFVDNILINSRLLLGLMEDILDISKIYTDKINLNIKKIHVPRVMDEILTTMYIVANEHGVKIGTEFDPLLDEIEADELRFKQIMFKLINNAIKFSKKDNGIITITTRKKDDLAWISIKDTGIGIKKNDLDKLFIPFTQLDTGSTRKYGGTGLGLAITKKLVEMHGGSISVESTFNKGSTFTFSLPLKNSSGGEAN